MVRANSVGAASLLVAHLDLQSVQDQIAIIKKIQDLANPPGILLISHLFVAEACQSLQECSIL